jgi:hypothetical protein
LIPARNERDHAHAAYDIYGSLVSGVVDRGLRVNVNGTKLLRAGAHAWGLAFERRVLPTAQRIVVTGALRRVEWAALHHVAF